MKKLIVVLMVLFFTTFSWAYTAQTKGTVLRYYWKTNTHVVMVDGELIYIYDSKIKAKTGDDVLLSVELDGPEKPVVSIIYVFDYDSPYSN